MNILTTYRTLANAYALSFSPMFQVWASKWNERAYFSTRKVKLDHDYLCMAVLVQEIINADYAFVIHTTNPSSGDLSEIYAEVMLYQLVFHASISAVLCILVDLVKKLKYEISPPIKFQISSPFNLSIRFRFILQ